ncbi:hypothetical protein P692DRAFT_20844483 [Suillus brevipes Sb2]|nr:hypothetical protein P692DRAFT_20844483 [Suillus brevipes Sb2]
MESGWQPDLEHETLTDSVAFDGLKINFEQEYVDHGSTDSDELDIDEEVELDVLNDEEFGKKLAEMAETEDGKDPDWIPERLQRKMQKAAAKRKHASVSEPAELAFKLSPSITLSHAQSVSMMSDPTFTNAVHDNTTNENANLEDISGKGDAEEWEQELDSTVASNTEILGQKALPLSHINQLLILSNFTTLHLKGASRIGASLEIACQWHDGNGNWFACQVHALARHYQIFEQLPVERRGGSKNARSFLHDESVQNCARMWLSNLPIGTVTLRALQSAVMTTIFPELGIVPKNPISKCTAQRWLIKLGWRRTVIRKGVYMDGHEREDSNSDPWWTHENLLEQIKSAIEIHKEVSSPGCQALFIFDNSSAHTSLPPDALKAFNMNKFDVIPLTNPDISRRGLVQKMTNAKDEPEGLKTVLEERGFNVQGLCAKCSPVCPIDNKSCCMARLLSQQDDFSCQTLMLEELIRSKGHKCIFLPKFHFELNPIEMYWGWCKYHYREASKLSFAAAKKAAQEILDSYPVEVNWRFINRSYHFMSAYRIGLTGKVAEWVVCKQRQHCQVSQCVMMAIEAVLS